MIEKIQNLSQSLRVIMCIIITIICVAGSDMIIKDAENKENNYDYSDVTTIRGTVTKAHFGTFNTDDSADIHIRLENGKTIKIGVGGSLEYHKGDTITVYTDGKYYGLRKESIAIENEMTIINFFAALALIVFIIVAWFVCFFPGSKEEHDKNGM